MIPVASHASRRSRASLLAGSALSRLLLALPLGGMLWLAVFWAWGGNA